MKTVNMRGKYQQVSVTSLRIVMLSHSSADPAPTLSQKSGFNIFMWMLGNSEG